MDFPKRIQQHKSQSDSFAILLYKLKDLGIFRNATENDYGIDFEIEIVKGEQLSGNYLKAQVKSAKEVKIRKDGTPTVGSIKQSTLAYWAELSFRTHVIVFAVDLTSEDIYFTNSIFWQATCLLDKSNRSKTINFNKPLDFQKLVETAELDKKPKEILIKLKDHLNTKLIQNIANQPLLGDTIYAHKTLLRNINDVFELYSDTWHYDAWTEVQRLDIFKIVLECGFILLHSQIPKEVKGLNQEERRNLFSFDYWAQITDWSYDEVSNQVAKKPLKVIYPLLLDKIQEYCNLVLKGAYYWLNKDVTYLKLVFKTKIPNRRNHDELFAVDYEYNDFESNGNWNLFYYELKSK
jgi:hypothetical protein